MPSIPQGLQVNLDRRSGVPLHLQLRHHITFQIGAGVLPPGTSLPSVRQLAEQLGIATATVQRTYKELEAQGVLVAEAGRSVRVAELAPQSPDAGIDRPEALAELLVGTISLARSLGYSKAEIVAVVRHLVAAEDQAGATPRVVYVARSPEYARHYREYLGRALADLGFAVESLTFDQLETRPDAVLDRLEPIGCLVCIAGNFVDLRRIAGHRGTLLFPLVFDVTEDTQEALATLPHEVPVGLVVEEQLMPTRRAVVHHYHGTEANLVCASQTDPAAVQHVVETCPIILYALGARDMLVEMAPPTTRLIELRSRASAASLARLRALLLQERRGGAGEAATTPATAPRSESGLASLQGSADPRPTESTAVGV